MKLDDKVPCCMADAARKVKKINIGGTLVGISRLDAIIDEIFFLKMDNEVNIKEELNKMVKIYNFVPTAAEEEYKTAIYQEFRLKKGDI